MGLSQQNPFSCTPVRTTPGLTTAPDADWSNRQVAGVIGAIAAVAMVPGFFTARAVAQTLFPDVPANYWAQPFIEILAQQGIVEGYPDGTFRPEAAIDRDEYATVIWRAFETDTERSLDSASTLGDVPEGYWAASAIEEAYEMGFMELPETNQFEPQAEVSRAAAISALVQGLELSEALPVAAAPTTVGATAQPRRGTPFHLAIPMASTELMQVFAPPAPAAARSQPRVTASSNTSASPSDLNQSALDLSQYYADANQIPAYARENIARATQLGLIVNYPDVELLNPTQPISRGSTAALVHQALVYQDRLEPLPASSAASPYQVEPDTLAGN